MEGHKEIPEQHIKGYMRKVVTHWYGEKLYLRYYMLLVESRIIKQIKNYKDQTKEEIRTYRINDNSTIHERYSGGVHRITLNNLTEIANKSKGDSETSLTFQ